LRPPALCRSQQYPPPPYLSKSIRSWSAQRRIFRPVEQAIDDLCRKYDEADGRDDYRALEDRRNENIATLVTIQAKSAAGIQAKAASLQLRAMIADQDQHQQISVSLADDLVALGPEALIAAAGATALALPTARAAAQTLDTELIELGTRFEPLVDRYYVAQRRWSGSLAQAHAEHDREFGDPADRNYEYPPEIVAAFSDSCERSGANEADDALSAIHQEMKQLASAINAASVTSIKGLRAKALVAFWEVAPLCAGDTEFSFEDAYPFQQLFTAVAELCGLKDKMVATGYELPDIAMVDDDSDDDSDDEGGAA
jgi:hypothetical protein